jgi:hypothetical protein
LISKNATHDGNALVTETTGIVEKARETAARRKFESVRLVEA